MELTVPVVYTPSAACYVAVQVEFDLLDFPAAALVGSSSGRDWESLESPAALVDRRRYAVLGQQRQQPRETSRHVGRVVCNERRAQEAIRFWLPFADTLLTFNFARWPRTRATWARPRSQRVIFSPPSLQPQLCARRTQTDLSLVRG